VSYDDYSTLCIKLKKLHPDAKVPCLKTIGSSGADVYSVSTVDIPPKEAVVIPLGFAVSIPEGYEIQVRPRSGLAARHWITVLNSPGTIDSDYRGELTVLLINHSQYTYRVNKGDRIAQLIFSKVYRFFYEVVEDLDETVRGAGGFGSTGKD
jgi:dUTP pyrophosphatase